MYNFPTPSDEISRVVCAYVRLPRLDRCLTGCASRPPNSSKIGKRPVGSRRCGDKFVPILRRPRTGHRHDQWFGTCRAAGHHTGVAQNEINQRPACTVQSQPFRVSRDYAPCQSRELRRVSCDGRSGVEAFLLCRGKNRAARFYAKARWSGEGRCVETPAVSVPPYCPVREDGQQAPPAFSPLSARRRHSRLPLRFAACRRIQLRLNLARAQRRVLSHLRDRPCSILYK